MTKNIIQKKQETLGRWGMAITALMLIFSAVIIFFSGASLWVVSCFFVGGLSLPLLALVANAKIATKLGAFFPIGF